MQITGKREEIHMWQLAVKSVKVVLGLFICSIGLIFGINANIGLAPWDAFSIGIANVTGISYGNIVILTGIVILLADYLLKEKIGVGTILNTVLIGFMADLILKANIIPVMHNFYLGIIMLLLGQVIIGIGSYIYIKQGLGSGPRDSLMTALVKIFHKTPIGLVRGGLEGSVLLIGWLLGAKVGIGTVLSVVGISVFIQIIFSIMHFDVKTVCHESVFDTAKNMTVDHVG